MKQLVLPVPSPYVTRLEARVERIERKLDTLIAVIDKRLPVLTDAILLTDEQKRILGVGV